MGVFFSSRKWLVSLVFSCAAMSAQATTVRFHTVLGDIDVNLFDKTTPEAVQNFLHYLNSGAYNNGVIHRVASVTSGTEIQNFVVQGGSYTYRGSMPLTSVKTAPPIVNQPIYSNVRGTIAMARLGNQPDSASSGWFFNMRDNQGVLDYNEEAIRRGVDGYGYTVFGQVTEASLPVLEQIAAVNRFFVISNSPEFPLLNYTLDDYINNSPVDDRNLVMITQVTILDTSPNTADSLNPIKNPNYVPETSTDDKEGGSLSLGLLGLLVLIFGVKTHFPVRKTFR